MEIFDGGMGGLGCAALLGKMLWNGRDYADWRVDVLVGG